MNHLTHRENQVLELVANGLPNADIAGHLGITEKTVKNTLTAIGRTLLPDSRGGSMRVRLALIFHKVGPYAPTS